MSLFMLLPELEDLMEQALHALRRRNPGKPLNGSTDALRRVLRLSDQLGEVARRLLPPEPPAPKDSL